MDIELIRQAAQSEALFFTDHAVRQMAKRGIMDAEVSEAVRSRNIIEEYPDDKYGPSCLIYGRAQADRPLHVQCSLPPRVRIITAYQPSAEEWEDDLITRKAKR